MLMKKEISEDILLKFDVFSKVFKIKWSVAGIIMFFVNYFWYYVIVCEFEALYVLKLYVALEI